MYIYIRLAVLAVHILAKYAGKKRKLGFLYEIDKC